VPTLSAQAPGYLKAYAVNSTDAAYPSRIPTTTSPISNPGAIQVSGYPTWLSLIPYAIGSAGNTFTTRILLWRKYQDGTLWVPQPIIEFVSTLGTETGVAGSDVLNTELFATTIATPTTGIGSLGVNCQSYSPGDNTIAHMMLDTQGATVLEAIFKIGTCTSVNSLLGLL
jgi:hypothetical protein